MKTNITQILNMKIKTNSKQSILIIAIFALFAVVDFGGLFLQDCNAGQVNIPPITEEDDEITQPNSASTLAKPSAPASSVSSTSSSIMSDLASTPSSLVSVATPVANQALDIISPKSVERTITTTNIRDIMLPQPNNADTKTDIYFAGCAILPGFYAIWPKSSDISIIAKRNIRAIGVVSNSAAEDKLHEMIDSNPHLSILSNGDIDTLLSQLNEKKLQMIIVPTDSGSIIVADNDGLEYRNMGKKVQCSPDEEKEPKRSKVEQMLVLNINLIANMMNPSFR